MARPETAVRYKHRRGPEGQWDWPPGFNQKENPRCYGSRL
jgi:hypothetical protein